jgi:hypothetical protein
MALWRQLQLAVGGVARQLRKQTQVCRVSVLAEIPHNVAENSALR